MLKLSAHPFYNFWLHCSFKKKDIVFSLHRKLFGTSLEALVFFMYMFLKKKIVMIYLTHLNADTLQNKQLFCTVGVNC